MNEQELTDIIHHMAGSDPREKLPTERYFFSPEWIKRLRIRYANAKVDPKPDDSADQVSNMERKIFEILHELKQHKEGGE